MSNTIVNTNVMALNSHRNLTNVGLKQSKASSRLSSGLRINSAADDAAGLAISEKMRGQIRGLDMAAKNGQDGISMIQTAEGGMQEIQNMVQRIRELAVQSVNGTNETTDQAKIQDEVTQLVDEIDNMAKRVEFNKKTVLTGNKSVVLQIGANAGQNIKFTITDMGKGSLTLGAIAGSIGAGKDSAITIAEAALAKVSSARAKLGAVQNRVEYTVSSLKISSENLSAAESRIRDTDMAKEMMNLTKANVLQQAATSMLAQANQAPQSVLQLLQ